jgi:hypothetical protein
LTGRQLGRIAEAAKGLLQHPTAAAGFATASRLRLQATALAAPPINGAIVAVLKQDGAG